MKNITGIFLFLLIACNVVLSGSLSESDTTAIDSSPDSTISQLQFSNPQLQFKMNDSLQVRFDAPKAEDRVPYYDPTNVIPDNPLELDYREGSYYTPRMVSDRMDQIMNRPRSDSFVPIPSLALLAASVALQMIKIDFSSQATAVDYLQDQDDLTILKSLWKESPQTATELLKNPSLSKKHTYGSLKILLEEFSKLNLVKRKIIEAGPTQYFPAQSRADVLLGLKHAQETPDLSDEEKTSLLRITNFIEED